MCPTEFRPLLIPFNFLRVYFKMKIKSNGNKHFPVTDHAAEEIH